MSSKGQAAVQHLAHHLKVRHTQEENKELFDRDTIDAIGRTNSLRFCTCDKHKKQDSIDRLFATTDFTEHQKRDQSRSQHQKIGVGIKWTQAHEFVAKTLASLDANDDSFSPKWAKFRTRYFDYYRNKNIIQTALSAYDSIVEQLVALDAEDDSPIAITLWFLTMYFEPLIFRSDSSTFSLNSSEAVKSINKRVDLLLKGDIEPLWISLTATVSKKGQEETPIQERVDKLMRLGRYSDATSAAVDALRRIPIDDSTIADFENAVVPPLLVSDNPPDAQPRDQRRDPVIDKNLFSFTPPEDGALDPDLKDLKRIIGKCKKGKGAGALGDTLDFYRAYASRGPATGAHLRGLLEIFRRIIRGQLPASIRPPFNVLAGCLFLKPETSPPAFRPIGIPTALNRLVGKFFCNHIRQDIAKSMMDEHQFAVGVKGGMELLIGSLQLLIQKFVNLESPDNMPEHIKSARRALFSLDLSNMFNVANLDVFFDWCDRDPLLSKFIPYFETRYRSSSVYILQREDGRFQHVVQSQGSAQGCPLAGLIAACCLRLLLRDFLSGQNHPSISPPTSLLPGTLHSFQSYEGSRHEPFAPASIFSSSSSLLTDLDHAQAALQSIQTQQEDFDETRGAPVLCFMDDMSSVASYDFLIAFARFLKAKGAPSGIFVNAIKCQLLLGSTWDQNWRDHSDGVIFLHKNIFDVFTDIGIPITNIITSPDSGPTTLAKISGGLKILGAPFGFSKFVSDFRKKTLRKQKQTFDAVVTNTADTEHLYKLIRYCVIPMVYHMFTNPSQLDDTTLFALECHEQLAKIFETYLNNSEPLDDESRFSFQLSTLLTRQGGISFVSPQTFFIAGLVASWSRLFALAPEERSSHDDSDCQDSENVLPESKFVLHESVMLLLKNEREHPSLRCIVDFNRAYDILENEFPNEIGKELSEGKGIRGFIQQGLTPKLQHKIVEATTRGSIHKLHAQLVDWESTTGKQSHLLKILPSVTGSLASQFLDCPEMGDNKLTSASFIVSLKIKLGLPLIRIAADTRDDCPFCKMKRVISRHGRHIFRCAAFLPLRTKHMHNNARDVIAKTVMDFVKTGSSAASFITSVTIEKVGLIPGTSLRPADVFVTFASNKIIIPSDSGIPTAVGAAALDITYASIKEERNDFFFLSDDTICPPDATPHLIAAERDKRRDTHKGATPEGTASFLATSGIGLIPVALDAYGGTGASMADFLFGAAIGRPYGKQRNAVKARITATHLAAAGWITENLKPSEDARSYKPPYQPSALSGQLKAVTKHTRLTAKDSGDDGDGDDAHETQAVANRILARLSARLANGVSMVAQIFVSTMLAPKVKIPNLPLLSASDLIVSNEIRKLQIEAPSDSHSDDEDSDASAQAPDDADGRGYGDGDCAVGRSDEDDGDLESGAQHDQGTQVRPKCIYNSRSHISQTHQFSQTSNWTDQQYRFARQPLSTIPKNLSAHESLRAIKHFKLQLEQRNTSLRQVPRSPRSNHTPTTTCAPGDEERPSHLHLSENNESDSV